MKKLIDMAAGHRRLAVFLLMAAVLASPVFAGTTFSVQNTAGDEFSMDLSFVKNAVNLIVGIFAGGYVLIKAAMDIFHAVRNSDQDPNGLKKAIGALILDVAVLAGFMFVVNYVFGGMADSGGESTAQSDFFKALAGALVRSPR